MQRGLIEPVVQPWQQLFNSCSKLSHCLQKLFSSQNFFHSTVLKAYTLCMATTRRPRSMRDCHQRVHESDTSHRTGVMRCSVAVSCNRCIIVWGICFSHNQPHALFFFWRGADAVSETGERHQLGEEAAL